MNTSVSNGVSNGIYYGIERRTQQRRILVDRREMIRFELDKQPRRSGNDRRRPDSVWNGRDRF